MADRETLKKKIMALEGAMTAPDFWTQKEKAQSIIKEMQDLKAELEGVGKYDKGDAIVTIFSGAGGDDAEDFSRMLFEMYAKYARGRGWHAKILDENQNDHGGYRSITFEVSGKNIYADLKGESGV